MSLLAIWAVGAAENVRQQSQREREKEAMFRGEQVADAIRAYYVSRGAQGVNSLPTSVDQLLDGIPRGTKNFRYSESKPPVIRSRVRENGSWLGLHLRISGAS